MYKMSSKKYILTIKIQLISLISLFYVPVYIGHMVPMCHEWLYEWL